MLRAEYAESVEYRELFRKEARLGAQLGDRGTVPVLDIIETPEVFAFVMPYAGVSLREIVVRRGPLDVALTQRILIQVADVLARLHRRGMLHRDVKPDNVLVDGEGEDLYVRLSDFGMASMPLRDRGVTAPLLVGGTPQFMSPEQTLHTVAADQRGDVYSLGVLAYFVLSGAAPFDDTNLTRILELQRREAYEPLRKKRHDVPVMLEAIIRRCLKANPNRRWQHAGALRTALIEAERAASLTGFRRFIARWLAPMLPAGVSTAHPTY
jgi:serine/threonine-protein kinase